MYILDTDLNPLNNKPDQKRESILNLYNNLMTMIEDLKRFQILPFNAAAHQKFIEIGHVQTAVGTRDRRIAAIAISNGIPLVTNNRGHFALVPGLTVLDWMRA